MREGKHCTTWGRGIAVIAIVSGLAVPTRAQDSRTEERAQQQAQKVITPNLPSGGERVFDWLEQYMTSSGHWYLKLGTVMPGSGVAPGVGYRGTLGNRVRFNALGAWSPRGDRLAEGTLKAPFAGGRFEVAAAAQLREGGFLPFYGLSSASSVDQRTSYGLKSRQVGIDATMRPMRWLRVNVGTAAESLETGSGRGRFPSIETVFDASAAPGLMESPDFLHSQATVAIDWRESEGYTRSGGYYAAAVHLYDDRGDDRYSFRRLDADARQFIPLVNEHWVVALRAGLSTTDHDADQQVPFFLLPALGSNTTLRGYRDGRFRGGHALLMSAEYRWIPGRVLDMALFVDTGKVAARRSDLDFKDLQTSYGIGARFHGPAATMLRVETARSREGLMLIFTFGQSF